MIGALWTGISGLSGQQTALDNESHNIANVNTIGYKASRISFADQLYQDKIGKGTKVLDAEKLFTQGNLKLTGVAYDMAISGDGFFSVKNERASGTAETFFTRAGNFRMGDDGTLQDAAGNKVQGWGMTAIDPDADVVSTNPNVNVFTTDYTKLVSSKIISHSNYVETITAKTTDYATTAEADAEAIYTGAGLKSKSAKVADIEELVADYTTWLQRYQDDPEATSATSKAQVSQIKFEGDELNNEGDQIYVYINGNKITQSYISVVATEDVNNDGLDPSTSSYAQTQDNIAASKIATYKALADQISQIPGLAAYTVTDGVSIGQTAGTFESGDTFTKTTAIPDANGQNALLGMIQIEGLIPGESFEITEVATVSGTSTYQGVVNSTGSNTAALQGSGLGALESSRAALAKAVSGSQRDVFTLADLNLGNADLEDGTVSGEEYTLEFVVYDKDTKENVNVGPINLVGINSIDEIVAALPNGGTTYTPAAATLFNKYFTAENINGNLVIGTNNANYDVEYSTTLTASSKGFENTKSLDSQNREVATFDDSFMPTPDAIKDYSFEFNYAVNAPTVASTLDTSTVQMDLSTITEYPANFTFSFTFEDGNNSISRGGGNQVVEIEIDNAISEADLAAQIEAQLEAINAGEFDATYVAPTQKVDTITFDNTAIPNGEQVSMDINGTTFILASDNTQTTGAPVVSGATIYVHPEDIDTDSEIATAFATLLDAQSAITATSTTNTLTITHDAAATGPAINDNFVDTAVASAQSTAPAAAVPQTVALLVDDLALDGERVDLDINGVTYTIERDDGGVAGTSGTHITVTTGTTTGAVLTALQGLIDADTANNDSDGASATSGSYILVTEADGGDDFTSFTYQIDGGAVTSGSIDTASYAGDPESRQLQVNALAEGDIYSIDVNGITYTLQVDSTATPGTTGNTTIVSSPLTAQNAGTALANLINADTANNSSDGTASSDVTGLITITEATINASFTTFAGTYNDSVILTASETTPYSPSPYLQIQSTDPSGGEAISAAELNVVKPSTFPPVNVDNVALNITDTVTLDFSSVTSYANDFSFSFTYNDANDTLGLGAGTQTVTYTASGSDLTTLVADLNTQLPADMTATIVAGTIQVQNTDGETISTGRADELLTDTTLTITDPADVTALAAAIEAQYGAANGGPLIASVNTDGELVVTLNSLANGGGDSNFNVSLKETGTNLIIEKNADFSGREGAGAEFIEVVNKIDQVASQGSLQLRLDTLGISDSAFGEFNVDNTGLITMKQDGASFAIGQVSIALFNNTRGLEPFGDNLMAKTTNSGEPIYNTNNERTANIEGGTLELSTADLSESLVNLMVFQRAFEANAKTITTSDALLNTLINLKR